jgi:lipopolysaccharide transport system ATP-binding protein
VSAVITAEGVGKKYVIRHGQQDRYVALRDVLARRTRALARNAFSVITFRATGLQNGTRRREDFWALKDVSFEVERGETVGIIGRNGAGKSTLLKVLSRITEPTMGRIKLRGRVASLLEVGTGFHPELTGRENIFLNGAILGMTKAEIKRKFDEIVEFAEIEKFLDTPVKRYSSGMYVRLAFAVAAHLEPEILLVDEVLAVGDAEFQKKCLGKMGEVSKQGRTILFVSHNMAAVQNLCSRCYCLEQGTVRFQGETDRTIADYLKPVGNTKAGETPGTYDLNHRENRYLEDTLIIKRMSLLDSEGQAVDTFQMGQQMTIVVDVDGMSSYRDAILGVIFKSMEDQTLAGVSTGMVCSFVEEPRHSREQAVLRIPQLPFTTGSYYLAISIARPSSGRIDYVDRAGQFHVTEADVYGTGYRVSGDFGFVYLDADWEIRGCNK